MGCPTVLKNYTSPYTERHTILIFSKTKQILFLFSIYYFLRFRHFKCAFISNLYDRVVTENKNDFYKHMFLLFYFVLYYFILLLCLFYQFFIILFGNTINRCF